MLNAQYKTRPVPRSARQSDRIELDGTEKPNPKPHPQLLAGPRPITLADQIRELTRASRLVRGKSLLETLPEDEFFEDFEDELSDIGLTEHEIAGLGRDFDSERLHRVPAKAEAEQEAAVSGREEPAPTKTPPTGA